MAEKDGKQDCDYKGITCKRKPDSMPIERPVGPGKISIDHNSTDPAPEESPESVGHHHEKALGAGTDTGFTLTFNIQ
jgi:hypothetical protein